VPQFSATHCSPLLPVADSPIGSFRLVADTADESPPVEESEVTLEAPRIERGPLPGFGETVWRDIKEAPGLLWSDTKKVYGDPLNLVFLLGAGGASLALRPEVDDDIEDYYDKHHTFKEDWRDGFGAAGNPGTHFALAGAWYLIGQQAQDAKTYEVGKRLFSALTITGMSTMLLKVSANTDSPNGEQLAWPSGHVSSTMAMATVLNDAYGPLVGVPMFGLTALVGIERLDDREHHFSDLIFGAALGWVVAETVMKEHRPEIFGGELVPYVDVAGNSAGVAWIKPLGQ
jgi:membrane-associated phospholipid phosphatase